MSNSEMDINGVNDPGVNDKGQMSPVNKQHKPGLSTSYWSS